MPGQTTESLTSNWNKMTSESRPRFPALHVKNLVQETLRQNLDGRSYRAALCKDLTGNILDQLNDKLITRGPKGYKFITFIDVGANQTAGPVFYGSQCVKALGQAAGDDFAEASFQNASLYGIGIVWAVPDPAWTTSRARLTPTESQCQQHFPIVQVKSIIEDAIDRHAVGRRYEPVFCKNLTQKLSAELKTTLLQKGPKGYKFVSFVTVGSSGGGDTVFCASQCTWGKPGDDFAEFTRQNSSLYAMAIVWGIRAE
ncbi:TCTEX1D1 [Branchiostoma lanceolatum]|uniref:TCTEX1D1 protein n=1 Tax=Branchiostoma lanceolatum TaxID=7740 RepID=A0A8J9YYL0_BRALA|nr:TCTEX1D1 [Branchiostoma lanceolatum]